MNEKSGAKQDELDEGLMKSFAYQATGDVCPMQAVIGGITAQEVMKVRGCVCVCVHICTRVAPEQGIMKSIFPDGKHMEFAKKFYCPPTKLREANVFTGVCLSRGLRYLWPLVPSVGR